ncbi:MAG: DUF4252 domain-containing protein [Candidatus Symbiothrix sp.]|jgi:hypothetical protein|nr:DUF4252 domain-containing protein [Candidatus Symbiothrix sp.]
MKKLVLSLLVCFISFSLLAQDIVNLFLNKHGKDENIEVVTIGKKMLDLMQSDSIATPELREAIAGVENIKIITSKEESLNENYYNSAHGLLLKNKDFTELVAIDNEDQRMIVMVKAGRGVISELVLLMNYSNVFNLISLCGNINLEMLAKYSQNMDLNELHNLKIIEDKN